MKFTLVDPPAREYCWSDKDQGYVSGYFGSYGMFFRMSTNTYTKSEIPAGAKVILGLQLITVPSPKR